MARLGGLELGTGQARDRKRGGSVHAGFAVMKVIHDLATAVWVGGLIVLAAVIVPAMRATVGKGPQARTVLDAIQRRLSLFVYPSMAVLVASGLLLARHSPAFRGLFSFQNTYSALLAVKHVLVVLMIAIGLFRSLVLVRGGAAAGREPLKMSLLYVNIVLALFVLVLSGLCAALAGQ